MSDENDSSGVALVKEVLRAAGDSPSLKEAGNNLGQSALTITRAINNVLLPIAAVNFAFDKAKVYFNERFNADFSRVTESIPREMIVEPKASVAGPALQGLAFTHDEPELREMYLRLLATAVDARVSTEAHPAFVEIIKQLSGEEAEYLRLQLRSVSAIPIVELRRNLENGFVVVARHLLNWRILETGSLTEVPQAAAMVDNWVRLGLVEVSYQSQLTDPNEYEWVEKRPEYIALRASTEREGQNLNFAKGIIRRTSLGLQFAKAVGLTTG